MKFLVILPIVLLGLPAINGQCNKCLKNKVTCLDEKRYVFCFGDDIFSEKVDTCEEGYVCTDTQAICMPESTAIQPACPTPFPQGRSCSKCTTTTKFSFACANENTVIRCNNGFPDFSTIADCPEGYVCNVGYDAMCVYKLFYEPSCTSSQTTTTPEVPGRDPTSPVTTEDPNTTSEDPTTSTEDPTTSTEDPTTNTTSEDPTTSTEDPTTNTTSEDPTTSTEDPTTPSPEPSTTTEEITTPSETTPSQPATTLSPSEQCAAYNSIGRFPIGTDCTQYIICSYNEGQLIGKEFQCPGQSYYNPARQVCTLGNPGGCPDRDPSATINPLVATCNQNGGVGRYRYQNSCREYLICKSNNGVITGELYSCPTPTYYNSVTKQCGYAQQAGCV